MSPLFRHSFWAPYQCFIGVGRRAQWHSVEHARAGELLPKFFSIELGMPLALIKLVIEQKFFRDVKLSWANGET